MQEVRRGFRQLGDLDESLEEDHLSGSIEEVLKLVELVVETITMSLQSIRRETGVQLEQQLDGKVVEVTAVLDDLDQRSQATLA